MKSENCPIMNRNNWMRKRTSQSFPFGLTKLWARQNYILQVLLLLPRMQMFALINESSKPNYFCTRRKTFSKRSQTATNEKKSSSFWKIVVAAILANAVFWRSCKWQSETGISMKRSVCSTAVRGHGFNSRRMLGSLSFAFLANFYSF